jgi:hypothetical protein
MQRPLFPCVVCAALAALSLSSCDIFSRSERTFEPGAATGSGPGTNQALVAEYDALADSILEARKKEVAVVRRILSDTYARAGTAHSSAQASLKSGDQAAAVRGIEDLSTLVAQLGQEGDASVAAVRKRLIEGGHHFNPIIAGAPAGANAHGTNGAHHAPGAAHHQDGQKPAHHAEGQKPAVPTAGGHVPGQAPGQTPNKEGAHHHGDAHHQGAGSPGIGFDSGYVVVSRPAKKAFLDASRAIAALSTAPRADALAAEWAKVEQLWTGIAKGTE